MTGTDTDVQNILTRLDTLGNTVSGIAVQVAKHEAADAAVATEVRRIATVMERHELAHVSLAEKAAASAVGMEHRLTDLESTVRFRSGLGAVGMVLSWLLAAIGIKV